jgi:hypothetical protein
MTGPEDKDLFGDVVRDPHGSLLGDEFIVPPFSVLNAREGWWQERKRKWLALGIQSELGRGGGQPGTLTQTGLTWGDNPQITQSGLNFYREQNGQKR